MMKYMFPPLQKNGPMVFHIFIHRSLESKPFILAHKIQKLLESGFL